MKSNRFSPLSFLSSTKTSKTRHYFSFVFLQHRRDEEKLQQLQKCLDELEETKEKLKELDELRETNEILRRENSEFVRFEKPSTEDQHQQSKFFCLFGTFSIF